MSMRFFDTPSSRAKFERNLNFLAEAMSQGRFHIAPHLSQTIAGIRRVRLLPNRRIDLLTVDETTRLNANMMAEFAREQRGPAGLSDEGARTAAEIRESEE